MRSASCGAPRFPSSVFLTTPTLLHPTRWDRNTYRWRAATSGAQGDGIDVLPITMDRNLFVCNYRAYFPIDNDDGSNGYVQTNNFLLWGGSKTLMGYNKHFINNSFVYVDYTPATSPAGRALGGPPRVGNGYSSCASSIASYPWRAAGLDGLQEQWWNNTCIASSPDKFFDWYECNSTHPLDGTIPFPMQRNTYLSPTADYRMHCRDTTWTLAEAQAAGVDVGSTAGALPTVDELVAMAHDRLQF